MAKSRRKLVIVSDQHVGSTAGLWPGSYRVEGGGKYSCNQYQEWLLNCWDMALEEIGAIRPRPTIVVNGDPVQGTSERDGMLITNKTDIQADAAYEILAPLREVAKKFYMIRGTEWHEGKASESVEQLARRLKSVVDPASGQQTWWELNYNLNGPVAHIAHHVGASSVPWYEATVPLRDTLMLLAELWRFLGTAAPNVRMTIRSHRHRGIYVQAPGQPPIHALVTPGWQLKNAFGYKRASSTLPQIGYAVVEYGNSVVMGRLRTFPLPPSHVEGP